MEKSEDYEPIEVTADERMEFLDGRETIDVCPKCGYKGRIDTSCKMGEWMGLFIEIIRAALLFSVIIWVIRRDLIIGLILVVMLILVSKLYWKRECPECNFRFRNR